MITVDQLKGDQPAALASLREFLTSPEQFCVLSGPAGCGKTTLIQVFSQFIKGRCLYTAPTNKATRVLRTTLTSKDYTPECKTIYSALGLRLEANGELKELTGPDEKVDLSRYALIVIDEGSMIAGVLLKHLQRALAGTGIKVLILGDPYQLPPVGETRSVIWAMAEQGFARAVYLKTVLRHDNQILNLVTEIRKQIDLPFPKLSFASAFDIDGGVRKYDKREFGRLISEQAAAGAFSTPIGSKVVAWRNATVDGFNRHIRSAIFQESAKEQWLVGDRVIVTEPAKDFADEPFCSTDDEGVVNSVSICPHPVHGQFKCYVLEVLLDENRRITLWALHPLYQQAWDSNVRDLAAKARENKRLWKTYWEFQSRFHKVRHGYALTAHRSQGSTFTNVYVDYIDILANQSRKEAFQCLYVAASRPSKFLAMA